MSVEPGVIFAIVAGAALLLIVGMGIGVAAGLYTMDRSVRTARAAIPSTYNPNPVPVGQKAEIVSTSAVPAPLTRYIAAEGYADVAPTLGVSQPKLGMWAFIASEVIFFTSLIGVFVLFKSLGKIQPASAYHLDIILIGLNTFLLLSSSFTVVMAFEALQEGRMGRFRLALIATFILGAVFVSLQGVEWNALFNEGLTPTNNLFGTVFFVLTGFHGTHVIIGLLWLIIILIANARGFYSPDRSLGIEIFGLYWHFVDVVWIILFTIIYLI